MKYSKFVLGILGVIAAAAAVFIVLHVDHAWVLYPKGIIAESESHIIGLNLRIMLIAIVPALTLIYFFAWKYREGAHSTYEPERSAHGVMQQLGLWALPVLVVVILAPMTWGAAHSLDPFKPLQSSAKPLTVQVIAMDWKWLFLYPQEGIASVNFLEFPEQTPINFALTADGAPMNSFWIPQLSGQMYAMPGMSTPLHMMADGTGQYTGRGAEINGEGFAGMTFTAKSVSQSDFETWVASVKQSSSPLPADAYSALVQPSQNNAPAFFSSFEKDLYKSVLMKYMAPAGEAMPSMPSVQSITPPSTPSAQHP